VKVWVGHRAEWTLLPAGCQRVAPGCSAFSRRMRSLYCKWKFPSHFFLDETAQDVLEYALLLAFIALAGAAAFVGMGGSTNTIWSATNSKLAAGNSGS
jgi:Flp pilus assembly pilin Flp